MKQNQTSITAKGIAVNRALESRKPPGTRVCYDPFARQFIGSRFTASGDVALPQWLALWIYQTVWPGFHDYFVARTRHIDEYLHSWIHHDIAQIVILGAGYDSRAYRFGLWNNSITVFEVDHPATQQDKKAKVQEVFGGLPSHVVYVDVDFHHQTLAQRLQESGYQSDLKTAIIWEGVTYYLHADAVDDTLACLQSQSHPGSALLFDYMLPEVIEGTCPRREAKVCRWYVKRLGEELRFGLVPETIHEFLSQRGFRIERNVTTTWLEQTYFTGKNAQRTITPIFGIVEATVQT